MSNPSLIGRHLAVEPYLSAIPDGWRVVRFKSAFERREDRNTDLAAPMKSLRSTGEVVDRSSLGERQEPAKESLPRYLLVDPGDLVVNPMWLIGGAIGVSTTTGAVSPDYRVFRSSILIPRYAHYLLRSSPYVDQYSLYTRAQTTFDRRVQQPDLDNLPLAVPTVVEQKTIAEFLDHETAQIDVLVGRQERLVGVLSERREAVVAHAMGGLSDRHGRLARLGRRARIGNGSTPRREEERYWGGGNHPWLNSSVVNLPEVWQATQHVTDAALLECHLPKVRAGSLLVGLTGQGKTRGMATILATEATINQHLAYITPDPSYWDSRYLLWVLRADYRVLRRLSDENGSTKGGLTCDELKRHRVPRPNLEEQRGVAGLLDEQTAKIDASISKAQRFIELARERRVALITAAVTGKIDVRDKVA